jgi:hypothetical protein
MDEVIHGSKNKRFVKKQIWDGDKFIPAYMCEVPDHQHAQIEKWLTDTIGAPSQHGHNQYWAYYNGGRIISGGRAVGLNPLMVMDEKVYTWYQMKWGNK